MRRRPAIESLESRTLLSGNALDQPDDINHRAQQQLQSCYAIVNASGIPTTTYAAPQTSVTGATTSATQFMSAGQSSTLPPPPPGPPVISTHGPLLVAPKDLGGTGGIVVPPTPPEVHTSDLEGDSAPPAPPASGPTSLNQPAGAPGADLNQGRPTATPLHLPSASWGDSGELEPWAVLDACFANDDWASPLDAPFTLDRHAAPTHSTELDLLVTALGLATTAQLLHGDSAMRPQGTPRRVVNKPLGQL